MIEIQNFTTLCPAAAAEGAIVPAADADDCRWGIFELSPYETHVAPVLPGDDYTCHRLTPECDCRPRPTPRYFEDGIVWTHNARLLN